MDAVTIIQVAERELRLEWVTNASNDIIADSALALLCGIDSNFATIKSKWMFPYMAYFACSRPVRPILQ